MRKHILLPWTIFEGLDMHLMDDITTYLYGSIDNDIYIKILEGFILPEANCDAPIPGGNFFFFQYAANSV